MKRQVINKISLAAFFIFFLCILIPVSLAVGFSLHKLSKNEEQNFYGLRERQAQQVERSFANQLALMDTVSTHILTSRWLSRYANHIGLYDEEYDLYKRLEIIEEMKTQAASLDFVSDLLVRVPSTSSVISLNGWFGEEEFQSLYPQYAFLSQIDSRSSTLLLDSGALTQTYHSILSSASSCTVSMVIDSGRLTQFIKQASLGQFAGFSVMLYEIPVARWPEPGLKESLAKETYHGGLLSHSFSISIDYPSFQLASRQVTALFLLSGAGLLLLAAFFSAALAYVTTKPLNHIVKKLTEAKKINAKTGYLRLPSYVDDIIDNNLYLTKYLARQLEQYEKMMQSELLFRLLTDESVAAHPDEYLSDLIPWQNDGLPCCVLLLTRKRLASREPDHVSFLKAHSHHCVEIPLSNCDLCYLIWCDVEMDAQIYTYISKELSPCFHTALSDLHTDFKQISALYTQARNRLDARMELDGVRPISHSIPLSMESRLIEAIQVSSYEDCSEIVKTLWKQANRDTSNSLMMLLIRLSNEHGLNSQEFISRYNNQCLLGVDGNLMHVVLDFCKYLCGEIGKSKSQNVSDVVILIQKYIEDHFSDCNLSLKSLSEVFRINEKLLSRLYKTRLNVNFSDYLIGIRIARAKELLKDASTPITDLSKQVGYLNYTSFKRAFIRCEGLSPRQYRELNTK